MAKTTTEKRIEIEKQIEQLENQHKQLMKKEKEEERKMRTHRLCKRGGIVEKLLPELASLTDEQFDIFVNKILLSVQTKRLISDLSAQSVLTPAETQEVIPAAKSKDEYEADTAKTETDME